MTQTMTIDNLSRAPDAGYIRSDAEVAHQKAYEARETARGVNIIKIVYRIDRVPLRPDASYIEARKPQGAFVVVRRVDEGKEQRTAPMYRQSEAITAVREGMWRDRMAAERLGIEIQVTATRTFLR